MGFLSFKAPPVDAMETDGFSDDPLPSLPPYVIHAISVRELPHNNPLLLNETKVEPQISDADIQLDLLKILTQFMFGDELAAHFLLCHLISTVYARVSGEVLGKFSINLTCQAVPADILPDYIKKFYNLIELLVPDSVYLPLTIENFNTRTFVPKKDYATNRLTTGFLQLPRFTHVVLDETKLESGKLEEAGCLAVADLSELIRTQQISYDFKFYKIPFHTNIPVLILSEGKSMLPVSFELILDDDDDNDNDDDD